MQCNVNYILGSLSLLFTLSSGSLLFQVDLMRSYTFRNSKGSYRGIPIIAANMDTVGTFEMALALHQVWMNSYFFIQLNNLNKYFYNVKNVKEQKIDHKLNVIGRYFMSPWIDV